MKSATTIKKEIINNDVSTFDNKGLHVQIMRDKKGIVVVAIHDKKKFLKVLDGKDIESEVDSKSFKKVEDAIEFAINYKK